VEISNYIVEGLVDTGASMSVMAVVVVRELGMMHLVTSTETYKTASGIITQALGRIDEITVKVGGVQCAMTFMVVDTDGYDVLLGLDFLMKIGAVVDVERGLLQVRHGPGTNVEVLPLTVVNLLQSTNSGALGPKTPATWKGTRADRDPDRMPKQGQAIRTKEDDADTSDSDADINSSECYDSELSQLKQVNCQEEFKDADLEELVNSEGLQEMLRLMLQEQGDVLMTEELTDSDDYADWIRWVSNAEQSRRVAYRSTQGLPDPLELQQPIPTINSSMPILLQTVHMKDGDLDYKPAEKLTTTSPLQIEHRWKEICQRIRIDTELDDGGQQQI
jgi:hypothetical protein